MFALFVVYISDYLVVLLLLFVFFSWVGFFFIDFFRLWFIIFTFLLIVAVVAMVKDVWLFVVFVCLFLCFSLNSWLLFFLRFEFILFPMRLVIMKGKSGERFVAVCYFVIYTFVFSLCVLSVLIKLSFSGLIGSFYFGNLYFNFWMTLMIIFVFAVKFPVFFFHWWLPRAHVEATTYGSIVLAGCLLKLGRFGFSRFGAFFSNFFSGLVSFFFIGLVCVLVFCFLQFDLKRLVAYSSVFHMRTVFFCLYVFSEARFILNIIVSFSHCFLSANMFFVVGRIYESVGSRSLFLRRQFIGTVFFFSSFLLLVIFLNIGLPPFITVFCEIYGLGLIWLVNGLLGVIFLFSIFFFRFVFIFLFFYLNDTKVSTFSLMFPLYFDFFFLRSVVFFWLGFIVICF